MKRHGNPRTRLSKGMRLSQTNSARVGEFICQSVGGFGVFLVAVVVRAGEEDCCKCSGFHVKWVFANKNLVQSDVARCGAQLRGAGVQPSMATGANVYG